MGTGLYGWGELYGGCHEVFGFWFAERLELLWSLLLLTDMLLSFTSVWDEENIFLVGLIPPDIHDGLLWLSVDHHGLGVMSRLCGLPPSLNKQYALLDTRKQIQCNHICPDTVLHYGSLPSPSSKLPACWGSCFLSLDPRELLPPTPPWCEYVLLVYF